MNISQAYSIGVILVGTLVVLFPSNATIIGLCAIFAGLICLFLSYSMPGGITSVKKRRKK